MSIHLKGIPASAAEVRVVQLQSTCNRKLSANKFLHISSLYLQNNSFQASNNAFLYSHQSLFLLASCQDCFLGSLFPRKLRMSTSQLLKSISNTRQPTLYHCLSFSSSALECQSLHNIFLQATSPRNPV